MKADFSDRVQRSFDRSFGSYHDAACPQADIADRLVRVLRESGAPRHFATALELGCGTGHLTQRLCAAFGFGALAVNDLSPRAERTANTVGAAFLHGDAMRIEWPERLGLIASASMIQWLPQPAAFMRRAAAALAPDGWLAISGFGPEQYRELARLGSSATAPGLCRPGDLAAAVRTDLEIVTTGETVQTMQFSSPRKVLDHLRKTGVNGRAQGVWTKSRLAEFTHDYTRLFGGDAGVPLTYHATWIIARKRA